MYNLQEKLQISRFCVGWREKRITQYANKIFNSWLYISNFKISLYFNQIFRNQITLKGEIVVGFLIQTNMLVKNKFYKYKIN